MRHAAALWTDTLCKNSARDEEERNGGGQGAQAREDRRKGEGCKADPQGSSTRRIMNRRVVVCLRPAALASASGEDMAKTMKKAAKSRKTAKKSVAVKNLKAKGAKSKKAGMTAIRRRMN